MKKLNLLSAFTLFALIFSSCSKEPLEYESPYQIDKSFYFSMEMGRSRPTTYGYEDLNNKTKWGPAVNVIQDNDPSKLSTTIKVNNKFGIPVDMQGDLFSTSYSAKKELIPPVNMMLCWSMAIQLPTSLTKPPKDLITFIEIL